MLKAQSRAARITLCGLIQSAHQLHSRPFLRLKGVPVLVQGNGGVCVSQQLGEGHRVHPLLQSPCGKGMAQRMKVGAGDAGTGYAPLEQVLVGPGLIGRPILLVRTPGQNYTMTVGSPTP